MGRVRGLYKRGNIWWVCYQDPFGVMRFESSKSASQKEAMYLLSCRKKEVAEGKTPEVKRIKNHSFRELAEAYLNWARPQRAYKDKANRVRVLVEVFGNYALRGFTTRLVEEYQSQRLEHNKPATVNRMLTILKHTLRKATEWDMVEEEVLKRVRKVKQIPEHNTRLRFLSQEETQALIEACASHLKPIVLVALHTGMRKGEILGLKWSQVDLRHGFILLGTTKNGEHKEIPINATLRQVFESIPHGPESEYIFVNRDGRPFKSVDQSFTVACRRVGIQDFHFHDLRHTFASHLIMAGVDIITVKELLGHKTLTMTLRYAHLAPSHKVKAVKVLEERLKNIDVLYNYLTV